MKQTTPRAVVRVSVAEAKAGLSRLLRTVASHDVIIHNRGRDVARLSALGEPGHQVTGEASPFGVFLTRMEQVKRSVGLRGVEFEPKKASIEPQSVFGADE